jgi:photosystem II stability/assembly factor-like uncharacterized protein
MNNYDDRVTEALRDSLARHAAEAPRGDLLAERIIADAERGTAPRRSFRSWPTWSLPLIAAGAVAGVVAAVIGIQTLRPSASGDHQPGTQGPSLVQPTPVPVSPTSAPTTTQPSTTQPSTTATSVPPAPAGLTNVQVADLTFYGDNDGWALGSADCLTGPGRCTAVLHTTDGQHWTGMPGANFNVPDAQGQCADPCVVHLRFATPQIGYAFGPAAFFMTQDGGQSWQRQNGGAIALETLDNNVIRVTGTDGGCPGPCITGIENSAVGSSDWAASDFHLQGSFVGSVLLARGGGGDAYLLVTQNPAGGAANERSSLYRSLDKGLTWQFMGKEPCPQAGEEIDSTAIAAAPGGRVGVLCMRRMSPNQLRVATSTDAGAQFTMQPGEIPLDAANLLAGDPETVLVVAGMGMARSTDGGATWQKVTDVTGDIGWMGFESPTVGRAVSADGSTIWTTRDGGQTWRAASIG